MLQKNSLVQGLVIGLLLPCIGFAILYGLLYALESAGLGNSQRLFAASDFRQRTLGIVAIGLNAIPMNLAFKKKQTDTMRGIVIPTFLFVIVWLFFFGKSVL